MQTASVSDLSGRKELIRIIVLFSLAGGPTRAALINPLNCNIDAIDARCQAAADGCLPANL